MKTVWQEGTVSIVFTSRNSELTAATLWSLTRILFHEDYKVRRRCFPQVFFESCADGHGSASVVSLFYASFSSFLYSLLWRYCFSFPASRRPKQKWRLRPKRLTLPRKTPFSLLFLFFSGNQSWLIRQEDKYFTPRVRLCFGSCYVIRCIITISSMNIICVGALCNKWTLSGHENRIFNKHLPKQANTMHVSNSWETINLIEIIINSVIVSTLYRFPFQGKKTIMFCEIVNVLLKARQFLTITQMCLTLTYPFTTVYLLFWVSQDIVLRTRCA